MSISFTLEFVAKEVYEPVDLCSDGFHEYIVAEQKFDLGNSSSFRSILTREEINDYCGKKEITKRELIDWLAKEQYGDLRIRSAMAYLSCWFYLIDNPDCELKFTFVISWY